MTRILIDGDGCPVVDEAVEVARRFAVECIILSDTSHLIEKVGAKTLVFSKGADSVDFALVNLVRPGDLVITQDYGLAALCLVRSARVLSQEGMEYTADNIDSLLQARYIAKKIRSGGGRLKGPPKRTDRQNKAFVEMLTALLEGD